jgi:hypothetical protein
VTEARFLVGDVRARMAELAGPFDLVLTSPPFYALRSYLPDDSPHKRHELGSEADPAAYIDMLLGLTAEWRRLLAPHGSIAIELGDTYSGSGGAGGDYGPDGLRKGQPKFRAGTPRWDGRPAGQVRTTDSDPVTYPTRGRNGWPLPTSLCAIPALYTAALAYGINPLTGAPSPAGRWRVRNVKSWIRSNPPPGALGGKERPATSYVVVATASRARYFDLDAVRRPVTADEWGKAGQSSGESYTGGDGGYVHGRVRQPNPAGAPPLDWWHEVDAVLDAELARRAGKPVAPVGRAAGNNTKGSDDGSFRFAERVSAGSPIGAQGVHLRRALERAGILRTLEALDVSPKGYRGAHYAVWPPELVRLLVDEMCPRQVCTTCGGWTGCEHGTWRPGRVLDPFAGSGTTLAVTSGMGRDAVGIDLDPRNLELARARVGMFLTTGDEPPPVTTVPLPDVFGPLPSPPAPPVQQIEGQLDIYDALGGDES